MLFRSMLHRLVPGTRHCLGLLLGIMAAFGSGTGFAAPVPTLRNIAFYYGDAPALNQLSKFQFVVLEPDSGFMPLSVPEGKTRWLAYVSVGEVTPLREYYSALHQTWLVGRNAEWQSDLVDQAAPGWPAFFVEHVVAPLWERGYTGFFLDTLDSYQLFAKSEEQRLKNQEGLVAVIRAIHERFPQAVLIMNRGFELLPSIHDHVYAVAFESLFQGWSESRGKYTEVSKSDRQWLLNQARTVKHEYGLPLIAIDYCLPADVKCSRDTVRRIRAQGLVPYVGDGRLQTISLTSLR